MNLEDTITVRFSHLHRGKFTFKLDETVTQFCSGHNPPGEKTITLEASEVLPIFVDFSSLGLRLVVRPGGITIRNIPGMAWVWET